jgi:hypothetical protein
MKHGTIHWSFGILGLVALLLVLQVQETRAQWAYLDVEEGYGTLNLAIDGDTLANGTRTPNRVYRLKNGGFYLLNGGINNGRNGGFVLRVQAANAGGSFPILMASLSNTGATNPNEKYFDFLVNGHIKGLYFSGLDQLARPVRNMVQAGTDGVSVSIDSCFFDYDRQGAIRSNANEQKIYITNTIIRNCTRMKTQSTGRFIDLRGSLVDTLVVQNCTFYHGTGESINDQEGALIRNLTFDHNTMYGTDKMDLQVVVKGRVTNNIFCNVGWEAQNINFSAEDIAAGDTLRDDILPMDSLRTPLFTEADRNIEINRNSFSFSPKIVAMAASSADTIGLYVIHNSASLSFINQPDGRISSTNWLNEYPQFTDPPDDALLRDYAIYDIGPGDEAGTPDIVADRHPNLETDVPGTFGSSDVLYGLSKDEFKFSYPTTQQAYTFAANSLPLGDLNWFPDKKAIWLTTDVTDAAGVIPSGHLLLQNYPNPFNPTTTIEYQIAKTSRVSLEIFDLLGQKIKTLVQNNHPSGVYRVHWDGKDQNGNVIGSGVYLYQLKIGNETLTRKMIMIK